MGLFSAIRKYDFEPDEAAREHCLAAKVKNQIACATIFGLISLGALIAAAVFFFRAAEVRSWEVVEGTVLQSEMMPIGLTGRLHIEVRYPHPDSRAHGWFSTSRITRDERRAERQGSTDQRFDSPDAWPWEVRALHARAPRGALVPVFVHPTRPNEAVLLDNRLTPTVTIGLVMGIVTGIVALACLSSAATAMRDDDAAMTDGPLFGEDELPFGRRAA